MRAEIERAVGRIGRFVRRTPVVRVDGEAFEVEGSLTLKLEQLQHSGSFKARGAFNRVLSAPVGPAGVVAASGGNHGAAVAYAARRLGHRAEVFVPEISSPAKVRFIEECGGAITVVGRNYAEAYEASAVRAEESGAVVVHAYDQPEVVAGQGTVGLEIEEQAPELDTVLVAVGEAGLIGGVAGWYEGGTRVVGVEPEAAPSLHAALEAGGPVDVETGGLAADSLGARRVGSLGFSVARRFVEKVVLVDEAPIREAQRRLWESARLIVEPGGAVALTALLSGSYRPEPEERVGVLLCGANTDPGQAVP